MHAGGRGAGPVASPVSTSGRTLEHEGAKGGDAGVGGETEEGERGPKENGNETADSGPQPESSPLRGWLPHRVAMSPPPPPPLM
ncbi:hypothetical protein E2C01_038975 [Portunus trituberculatus]|uniref:Uncharacterized protein n=1 Tax=Portunus trituberculatus TaxID=210409 RepID=A0A5B7FCD5_PORTR|nr:hypothetical protein [Portunus trituberculatus]